MNDAKSCMITGDRETEGTERENLWMVQMFHSARVDTAGEEAPLHTIHGESPGKAGLRADGLEQPCVRCIGIGADRPSAEHDFGAAAAIEGLARASDIHAKDLAYRRDDEAECHIVVKAQVKGRPGGVGEVSRVS